LPVALVNDQYVIDLENINKFPAKFYYMQGLNVFFNIGYKF